MSGADADPLRRNAERDGNIRVMIEAKGRTGEEWRSAFDCDPGFAATCTRALCRDNERGVFETIIEQRHIVRASDGRLVYVLAGKLKEPGIFRGLVMLFDAARPPVQILVSFGAFLVLLGVSALGFWALSALWSAGWSATVGWTAYHAPVGLFAAALILVLDAVATLTFFRDARALAFGELILAGLFVCAAIGLAMVLPGEVESYAAFGDDLLARYGVVYAALSPVAGAVALALAAVGGIGGKIAASLGSGVAKRNVSARAEAGAALATASEGGGTRTRT